MRIRQCKGMSDGGLWKISTVIGMQLLMLLLLMLVALHLQIGHWKCLCGPWLLQPVACMSVMQQLALREATHSRLKHLRMPTV